MTAEVPAMTSRDLVLPARDGPGEAIVVRGLAKAYGRKRVLEVAELSIPVATITAIVGGNGAGKSTLLGCVAGVLRHEGRVLRAGGRGQVAYLPQRVRLPGGATVGEVMALFRSLAGPAADRVPVPDGFLPDHGRRIGELSGGQAQRVALAATLLGSPDVILLDEPLANLDDAAKSTVRDLVKTHRDAGATVVIASPAAFELLADADLVVRIEGGRVVFRGAAPAYLADLRSAVWVRREGNGDAALLADLPGVVRVHVDGRWTALECAGRDVPRLVAALHDRGVAADRIRIAGASETTVSGSAASAVASDTNAPEAPEGDR